MSELSALLGNAGAPHQITHDGKTVRFRLVDQVAKNALEKRLYQQAREAVYADREHLTGDEYATQLEKVREAYQLGAYAFLGEKATRILQAPKGVMLLLEVITGETEEELAKLLLARPEEVRTVLRTVMEESFPHARVKASS